MADDRRFLTAKEAAEALGVTPATLYSYISRGKLQSAPVPGNPRERHYYREDIERLRERKEAHRDPAKVAARGLHWGSPVLASKITLIHQGKLYYRGSDAIQLAREASLEQVAELLWEVEPAERERLFRQTHPLSADQLKRIRALAEDPIAMLQMALPAAASADLAAYDLRPPAVRMTAARILRLLTVLVTGRASQAPVHIALQATWAPKQPKTADIIRAALVLCADHELNVSAFTARCAASAGASPYDAISAGLAALKGARHGGETRRVAALFQETESSKRARTIVSDRLRRGENLPGFGHPLYPSGDPRASLLMELTQKSGNRTEWNLAKSIANAALSVLQDRPNLDFGMVALSRAYGLPDHAPLILFALGRTVGWIAHIMEQYASNELIRPRANYIGPAPAA